MHRLPSLLVVNLVLGGFLSGAEKRDVFFEIFQPLRTEVAALSPDGKRLAYSVREGDSISILSLEVGAPERATSLVTVAIDDYATGYGQHDWGNHPARIEWLKWVSAERVMVQSNLKFLSMKKAMFGTLYGFRFDGKEAGLVYSALDARGPVMAIDFIGGPQPKIVVAEPSRAGTDWKLVDAISGESSRLTKSAYGEMRRSLLERDAREARRMMSREEMATALLPARTLSWLEHHGESERFLVGWQDVADPGAFVVVDPALKKAWEFVRREAVSPGGNRHRSQNFDLRDQQGKRYTGTLVLPLSPRVKKAPIVLFLPRQLGQQVRGVYQPEVQALAEMGFAVAVIDGLASSPNSAQVRLATPSERVLPEAMDGRFGFRPNGDLALGAVDIAAEVAHQLDALLVLAEHFPVSRTAVALYGAGRAAEAALAVAAEHPGRVRCLVLLNPQSQDRMASMNGYPDFTRALAKTKARPVESALFFGFRSPRGNSPQLEPLRMAWASLRKRGTAVDMEFLSAEFVAGQPKAKADTFRKIEDFLVKQLISYSVKIGEMVELESFPDAEAPKN